MTDLKKTITRGALGIVAAGAMALASAIPAQADDRISTEEVIAGALVVGGIALLAGAFDDDDDRDAHRYDTRHSTHRVAYNVNPRRAVERCVRAAENQASRRGGWRYADVTRVHDVDRTRRGYRVEGRIEVHGNPHFRRDYDHGRFTCYFDGHGRPIVDFDNVRGLR